MEVPEKKKLNEMGLGGKKKLPRFEVETTNGCDNPKLYFKC